MYIHIHTYTYILGTLCHHPLNALFPHVYIQLLYVYMHSARTTCIMEPGFANTASQLFSARSEGRRISRHSAAYWNFHDPSEPSSACGETTAPDTVINAYLCMYVCKYVCMHIYHKCVCFYVYVYIYACMHVFLYVCMHILYWSCDHTFTQNVQLAIYLHTHTHTQTCTCTSFVLRGVHLNLEK
jgi:hypothetical protein